MISWITTPKNSSAPKMKKITNPSILVIRRSITIQSSFEYLSFADFNFLIYFTSITAVKTQVLIIPIRTNKRNKSNPRSNNASKTMHTIKDDNKLKMIPHSQHSKTRSATFVTTFRYCQSPIILSYFSFSSFGVIFVNLS